MLLMYFISTETIVMLISVAIVAYTFTYFGLGLVIARLVPSLCERYRSMRWVVPVTCMAIAWLPGIEDPEWVFGQTVILLPLVAIALILTRKMVPNYNAGKNEVLDDFMLNQSA